MIVTVGNLENYGGGDVSRCHPVHDIGECVTLMGFYNRDTVPVDPVHFVDHVLVRFLLGLVRMLFIRLHVATPPTFSDLRTYMLCPCETCKSPQLTSTSPNEGLKQYEFVRSIDL